MLNRLEQHLQDYPWCQLADLSGWASSEMETDFSYKTYVWLLTDLQLLDYGLVLSWIFAKKRNNLTESDDLNYSDCQKFHVSAMTKRGSFYHQKLANRSIVTSACSTQV